MQTLILVLPLLALVTMQSQVNSEIVVSYVVALHLWFIVCISFIFLALIELAVALIYVQRVADWKDREGEEPLSSETMPDETPTESIEGDTELEERKLSQPGRLHSRAYAKRASIFSLGSDREGSNKNTAHLIKAMLNQIYGPIDWRKSPQDRNKVDYVSRILFPSAFCIFITLYFTLLNT